MNYSIEKITTLIGARRYGNFNGTVAWLLTDSRSLSFAEETLFFAISTSRNDGHRYIADLYRRKVRNFVVENLPENFQTLYPQANFLKVPSTIEALQRLAERHRDEFNIPVVGITGSNGKTVVKEWLSKILSSKMRVTRSPKSYNSQTGVPLSVWLMNGRTDVAVFEAGISKPNEMLALADIIQPTLGILTNIGAAHQENFPSIEAKCAEKLRLFHNAKAVVWPLDEAVISNEIAKRDFSGELLSFSFKDERSTFFVRNVDKQGEKCRLSYVYNSINQRQEGSYTLPFIDDASIKNSAACFLAALALGMKPKEIEPEMSFLEGVAMRLEVKQGIHGCTLINDSYNSDVNSLDIALDFMNRRPDHQGRTHTLVLSDILQSGMEENALYAEVSRLAKERGVRKFIGIGEALERNKPLIEIGESHFFPNVDTFLKSDAFKGLREEVVLIKGARPFSFDRITEMLEQKVHETILQVNLRAVVDNLNHYRSFMKKNTKIVCMVKANAYGSGAVEVAKTLQDHRVDYLAVAVADEGVTLRKAGITCNIMVMNPEMTAFKTMFDYKLEPEVYNFRLLDAIVRAAHHQGITSYPVHIKLDTGMHRLGFNPKTDMEALIMRLKEQNAIIPRSVFSHFVGSDSDDFDAFSLQQFNLFDEASKRLQQAFEHKILRHICNSAGIEHFPERQLDMCRLGLGLYGIDSRDNHVIHNVCTLQTTILQLRHVPKEETVGYSRKGILQRDSLIAAIPIGYADGLNRHLGRGNCYCLVNGEKAPYVGNICMDVAMIDVTGIACKEGDSVEIFGDHLPVSVLSDAIDTIPYEILTSVSERVKRVYFQD